MLLSCLRDCRLLVCTFGKEATTLRQVEESFTPSWGRIIRPLNITKRVLEYSLPRADGLEHRINNKFRQDGSGMWAHGLRNRVLCYFEPLSSVFLRRRIKRGAYMRADKKNESGDSGSRWIPIEFPMNIQRGERCLRT